MESLRAWLLDLHNLRSRSTHAIIVRSNQGGALFRRTEVFRLRCLPTPACFSFPVFFPASLLRGQLQERSIDLRLRARSRATFFSSVLLPPNDLPASPTTIQTPGLQIHDLIHHLLELEGPQRPLARRLGRCKVLATPGPWVLCCIHVLALYLRTVDNACCANSPIDVSHDSHHPNVGPVCGKVT
ncbi:uncharacterized protein MYCFIDRAFT_176608 [Pseudocercospora fijiensis CIRAD86]|uniref:Uncharacterized protein n=1 Tax=Pseudocercospora fijiensis (strain CIRAD86) TaxID=383855 RepID=M3AW24_PSEFD|nr:uncharacterized protein MYCFIDRAFT_176608 [Pseudocercospora fijiensis CIRAD86]EME81318.1 hypothetical protein MYCFIDRAFT_176608 [Pseudocercospora fijiensis CIRAD86]